MDEYLSCAKIINTHGCRGTVKAECYMNRPEDFSKIRSVFMMKNGTYTESRVLHASVHKGFLLIDLENVTDMDAAQALKNTILYIRRDAIDLDENEYFEADLIGLPVVDLNTGKVYGTVSEIVNRGAQDLYIIKNKEGREFMLPARPEFVARVEAEKVLVTPIPGLLDDEI